MFVHNLILTNNCLGDYKDSEMLHWGLASEKTHDHSHTITGSLLEYGNRHLWLFLRWSGDPSKCHLGIFTEEF